MKKNKYIIALIILLSVLVSIVLLLWINLNNKLTFVPPAFDETASKEIPSNLDYSSSILNINDGYSVYINSQPIIDKDSLIVDFVSLETNNIWIKIRILSNNNVIAESGLVKPGEYLEKIKLNKEISKNTNITYMIMGYEQETYLSAGVVNLNTRVES